MKKLLLPILCCLFAVASCTLGGSYSATNMKDLVTMDQGRLVNDYGVTYTISEISGQDLPTLVEGQRYYAVFDILNEQLEIVLKHAQPTKIVTPIPAPDNVEEIAEKDPVEFQFDVPGNKYRDLGIVYYKNPKSNFVHDVTVYYRLEDAGATLHLYVFHEGNNENPAFMESKDLIKDFMVISVPISSFSNVNSHLLTWDLLVQDMTTKEYSVVRRTQEINRNY